MRKRRSIIVRMSLCLVTAMIIIAAVSSVWFERFIVGESRLVMYEEAEITTRTITQALNAFIKKEGHVTNKQLRTFVLSVKPNRYLDVTILDNNGNTILEPKSDIATGDDALIVSNKIPQTGWTVIYTYPKHFFSDYLSILRWRMALIGLIAFALVLITVVFIVKFVASPFVREQHRLVESKASMERDIDIAGKIQSSFLPHDLSGAEAILLPAKNIGGDLYDVIQKDDTCYFCIGDVSGKGIPASMFMASTVMLFRHAVRDEHKTSPAAIMQGINDTIARENKECMFVTMFIGALAKDGTLTYCNAGHCAPIVSGAFMPPATCMPVGVFDEAEYVDETMTLSAGESIFLYTDGVTEAMNDHGICFGEKRLLDLFANTTPTTNQVLTAVQTYAATAEQSDDITILQIGCLPADTLQFNNISSRLGSTTEIITTVLSKAASMHTAVPESMRLIVEELVTNIARYSYPEDGGWGDDDRLWITVEYVDSSFVLTFRDHGVPFNPLTATTPDFSLSVEERPVGGVGIYLVRQLCDDITYTYSNRANILRVTFA